MTKLESFDEWSRKTLAEFPDQNERETFDKAQTEQELELAVKKVLQEKYKKHIKNNFFN